MNTNPTSQPLCHFKDVGNVTLKQIGKYSIQHCQDPEKTKQIQKYLTKLKLLVTSPNTKPQHIMQQEASIQNQIKELHANDLAIALYKHGICKPKDAAAMVANNRPHCEQLVFNAIQQQNKFK